MPILSHLYKLLPVCLLALSGCTQEVNALRAERFVNPTVPSVEVKPSAVSLNLRTTPNGQSLMPDSLARLNRMLNAQGRLKNQTITLFPRTPAAARMADRLAKALTANGLPSSHLYVKSVLKAPPPSKDKTDKAEKTDKRISNDLLVISEAIVAQIPKCSIADPNSWTISPYSAVGSLGCANRANLARMVSDPRDLLRPRALAPGDGIQADAAVKRYHTDDVRDLVDIDFSEDN